MSHFNYGKYKNDKLDALSAASIKEPDPAKREQHIKVALREHAEQVHPIPPAPPGDPLCRLQPCDGGAPG